MNAEKPRELKPLDLETCKWLKQSGFPQGDWQFAYYSSAMNPDGQPVLFHKDYVNMEVENDTVDILFTDVYDFLCACPSLEELRSFANLKIKEVVGAHCALRIDGDDDWSLVRIYEFSNNDAQHGDSIGTDSDVKVAIVNLLKQVLTKGEK